MLLACGGTPSSSTQAPETSETSQGGELTSEGSGSSSSSASSSSSSGDADTSTSASTSTSTGTSAGATNTSGGGGERLVLYGGQLAGGGRLDLELQDGDISKTGVFDDETLAGAEVIDISGRWLSPAFIDSHVHLAYLPVAESLAAGGVAAAVDLAAPLPFLDSLPARPRVLASGPMVTAVSGYPTLSWGANGYGIECEDAAAATAAVDLVIEHGAAVIKLPITNPPSLELEALAAATARAHERGLKVTTHALEDSHVQLAASADVDVLAHTPLLPLQAATVSSWSARAVITTAAAFGASETTLDNLAALRDAGATILYGTDLGNTQDAGIQSAEIAALVNAGFDGAEILAAGTATPASYWGLDELGKAASVLVLQADPVEAPMTLSAPVMVFIKGEQLR